MFIRKKLVRFINVIYYNSCSYNWLLFLFSPLFLWLCIAVYKEYISRSIQDTIFVSSIYYTIVLNSKVSEVVLFDWVQFFYSTDFVFLMHSHSYFNTHLQYFHYQFFHIPTTILILKSHSLFLKLFLL